MVFDWQSQLMKSGKTSKAKRKQACLQSDTSQMDRRLNTHTHLRFFLMI